MSGDGSGGDDINDEVQLKNPHQSKVGPVKVDGRYRAQTSDELREVLKEKHREERLKHGAEAAVDLGRKVGKGIVVLCVIGAIGFVLHGLLKPYVGTWTFEVACFLVVFLSIFGVLIYARR
ncbi:MAG: hypothetical protein HY075_13435 [Deltaproteobacteria bacterium]|nr:hypothetical protein [Deltaproteobacteria bacterium]